MFWRFNLLTPSQIDTLLDQEDVKKGSVTLEEILDEVDVLQECKGQNQKLLDFLVRPENMEELVNMVIQEPDEDKEEKVRFKYPNTACELLTSDVPSITDHLAGDETLLNKVYSFLESETTLNPLQASFFGKVMGLLISRKSELMLEFLKSKEDFIAHLLRHIGTSAIMDVLLRLITCIENTDTRNACINWLNEQSIIQKLVGLIDAAHSEEKHCNASQCLCDIIRMGRDQMSHLQEKADNDPLLAAIESEAVVSDLLDHMFNSETKVESVLVNGLQIIQTLLEFRKIGYLYLNSPEGCQEQMTTLDTERIAHGVNNTLAAVSPKLNHLHQLLVNPARQHYHAMPTTIGNLDPPLGNTRLQVVRLVTSLLITNTHTINQELANLGTIAVIIDLFFKYSWNNFLHTQVEQCLCTILNMTPIESEDGTPSHPLLEKLLEEYNFFEKILDAWETNDNNQSKPGTHRPGYMGHLTRVANYLSECSEKGTNAERITRLFKNYSEELQQRWEKFVSGTLADVNKTNRADLVGSPTVLTSSDSEDPDFSHIPFPQESTMQQVPRKARLFGFNEDEFAEQEERVDAPFTDKLSGISFDINADESSNAATVFAQVCNERMLQFDDPDSDEDLWEDKEITFSKSQGGRTSSPQSTPQNPSRNDSDSDEDQNSEGSTDSEEELESPRRIYQVPSSTTSTSTTPPTTTSTTTTAAAAAAAAGTKNTSTAVVENMDVDSSDAWADFNKAPSSSVATDAMDTGASSWEQSSNNAQSSENTKEQWANFDQMFPTSTSSENSKDKDSSKENNKSASDENWADFTNFEQMESSDNKVVSREESNNRSVSPVAMDTNETPSTTSSNRMAQYMVSSGAADSSQHPTSSSIDDNVSSPPSSPRQAWDDLTPPDTPRGSSGDNVVEPETPSSTSSLLSHPQESSQTLPLVPADTISSTTETTSGDNCVSTESNSSHIDPDVSSPYQENKNTEDNCSSEVSSSTSIDQSKVNSQPDFLAGIGLIKPSSSSPSSSSDEKKTDLIKAESEIIETISSNNQVNSSDSNTVTTETTVTSETTDTSKKLEEIRAQAQEALDEFSETTGTGSTTQNGPV